MLENNNDIKAKNISFYENAYSSRFIIKSLLKQFFSYDQLSKTRRNLCLVKNIPQFSKRLSVLDYGFGHGTLLLRMPRRHRIFGCELSREAINNVNALCSLLRRKVTLFLPDELIVASSTQIFDLITCSHVIEHVDDDKELLIQFCNMMPKNGYLLLNVPINEVWKDPKHVREFTSKKTQQLLENVGFEVVKLQEADRWSAWILHHEYVSPTKIPGLFRLVRLICALLPIAVLNALERLLPRKFQCQQLIILARKK